MNKDVIKVSNLLYEGLIPEAENLIEELHKVNSLSREELVHLAQFSLSIGKLSLSLEFLDQILLRFGKSLSVELQKALTLISARRYKSAAELCEQIIEANPQNADAMNMLANCHLTIGNFSEAERLFSAAISIKPDFTLAIAGLSKCRRFSDDGLQIINRFKQSFAFQLDEVGKARVHYAIAKIYNDLGDYQRAWMHAKNANTILRLKGPYNEHASHEEQINSIIEQYARTRTSIQSSNSASEHILIVGMPRTGTTLMEQILSLYDQTFAGGEVPAMRYAMAFSGNRGRTQNIAALSPEQLDRCAAAYERYYSELGFSSGQRIVNKVPYNYLHIDFFKSMFPRGKIIYMKRSRMDVLASVYFEHFSDPMSYSTDLNDIWFVMKESERIMKFWIENLPNDIYAIEYEQLTSDFQNQSKCIVTFLGLDPCCLGDFTRSKNAVETPSVWQVRQGVYTSSTERWRRYPELVSFVPK